jgi:hypothetical protein
VRSSSHDDVSSPNPGHSHEVTSQVKLFNEAVGRDIELFNRHSPTDENFTGTHFLKKDSGNVCSLTRGTIQAPAMSKNVYFNKTMTSMHESD